MVRTIAELRRTPDKDLIGEHDARAPQTEVGINYYLDELARRDSTRLATQLWWMTLVMLLFTIVSALACCVSVWAVFKST